MRIKLLDFLVCGHSEFTAAFPLRKCYV